MVPTWFDNLLPEGALRSLVDRQLGAGRRDDFDLLAILGMDLPGAVVVRDPEGVYDQAISASLSQDPREQERGSEGTARVSFSLAGVELKFSMESAEGSLRPSLGGQGQVIAKLPNRRYPHMPEIEFSSMQLAAAAGVTTARCRLVPTARVDGLPSDWMRHGHYVLAVDRFDRVPGSPLRRHFEDFAQIVGARDDRKYTMANTETMLKITSRFSADKTSNVLEGVSRVVVDVLLGNTDDHLKNWSLLYRSSAQLSPAYDIVAWYAYDQSDRMALAFQGTKTSSLMGLNRFTRIASYLGVDESAITQQVSETVERACDLWPKALEDLPMPEECVRRLRERWERLALTAGLGRNGFSVAGFSWAP